MSITTPRIVMIVDHALRDLPGLVLVARKLAEAGAEVFLVPMYSQDREVFTLKPDFVVLNYLRKNNEFFVEKLLHSKIAYGILDTEGGFYGNMSGYSNVLSNRQDLYENVRCNLIWGQRMMDFWQKEYPHKHPLFLTGLPRFDFYSQNMRHLPFNFVPEKYCEKPLILVNTKVAIANPLFLSVEEEVNLYRNKLKMHEDKIQFYLKYGAFSIEDTISVSRDLSNDFPQAQVVIRPHPHENHQTYEAKIPSEISNLAVFRDGNVMPWILKSTAVIHRHCTTAIEAVLADKIAIAPQWMRTSAEAPDAEAISWKPKSRDELNDILHTLVVGKELPKLPGIESEKQRIIDTWLYKMDGQSHMRAANAILTSLPKTRTLDQKLAADFAFSTFSNRTDPIGKFYSLFNSASRYFPYLLWQLEKIRLQKWKTTQKFYSPLDCQKWGQPFDLEVQNKVAETKLTYVWAKDAGDYSHAYQGQSVKIAKS